MLPVSPAGLNRRSFEIETFDVDVDKKIAQKWAILSDRLHLTGFCALGANQAPYPGAEVNRIARLDGELISIEKRFGEREKWSALYKGISFFLS